MPSEQLRLPLQPTSSGHEPPEQVITEEIVGFGGDDGSNVGGSNSVSGGEGGGGEGGGGEGDGCGGDGVGDGGGGEPASASKRHCSSAAWPAASPSELASGCSTRRASGR